ncbi:hypothetical protein C8Q77DRAFT_930136 [Trametes polyzona]|nr:hypothetical protein C8Q77DRAFT_930136 [Trametes polyzona]
MGKRDGRGRARGGDIYDIARETKRKGSPSTAETLKTRRERCSSGTRPRSLPASGSQRGRTRPRCQLPGSAAPPGQTRELRPGSGTPPGPWSCPVDIAPAALRLSLPPRPPGRRDGRACAGFRRGRTGQPRGAAEKARGEGG